MIDDFQLTPTLPDTEDIASQTLDFNQTLECGWGLLLPIISENNLRITVLTEDCYNVGRSPTCNITLTPDNVNSSFLAKISKVHFRIIRTTDDNITSIVYLEDTSSNGTYINGTKVGRNKRVILSLADEIALATPTFKVFCFIGTNKSSADQWLPGELSPNFFVLRHLGSGGFGDVKLVIEKKTFHKYAMKKVENSKEREKSTFNEVNILKKLEHPCIINFEAIYETSEAVFIALEYMSGGNLLQRIQTQKKIPENECKIIFYQLILGVKYLHNEGVVHRDLKPENVLLEIKRKGIIVKITDFGLSKILHSATNLRTTCGTLRYTAPEVLKVTSGNYNSKIDIWSLGVMLFYCLSGELPFISCVTINALADSILKGAYVMVQSRWHLITGSGVQLVKHMLKINPENRISSTDLILHIWFKDDIFKASIQVLLDNKYLHFNDSNESLSLSQEFNIDSKRQRLD